MLENSEYNIIIVEDEPTIKEDYTELASYGLPESILIMAIFQTLAEFEAAIAEQTFVGLEGETHNWSDVQLALVDGSLSKNPLSTEGADVVKLIKEKQSHILTIGISATDKKPDGIDYYLGKPLPEVAKFKASLDKLLVATEPSNP